MEVIATEDIQDVRNQVKYAPLFYVFVGHLLDFSTSYGNFMAKLFLWPFFHSSLFPL